MKETRPSRELPEDHLATTDQSGHRVYLYPADVHGFYRTWKVRLQWVLVVFFLVLPWIQIRGRQALLLDIPNRRFTVFGLEFWAHDGPMVLFVLGSAALSLLLVTAIFGRVWCGWACPQTVFVDGLFRWIERKIEGDSLKRRALDAQAWSFRKLRIKGLKWSIFTGAALILTHSFLAYFIGVGHLGRMMASSPFENPTPFLIMLAMTGLVLFDFGWFREQFCTIVCPYGRFQSVLMDERSMAVLYDTQRGEPRRGKAQPGQQEGDCVNCYRCVQVCPTGVDIRRGVQMECIACTGCIDACDDVMTRLGKPKGLIRYDSLQGMAGGSSQPFRVRTAAYFLVLSLFAGGLAYTVSQRENLDAVVMRAIDTPYQAVGTEVINHFKVDLSNQSFGPLRLRLETVDPNVTLIVGTGAEFDLDGGKARRIDFFVKFPRDFLKFGRGKSILRLTSTSDQEKKSRDLEVSLVGPFQ